VRSGAIGLEKALAVAQLPIEQQAEAIKAPLNKPAKHQGKPKKVPAVKLVNAEIKAAQATQAQSAAEERTHQLEDELRVVREQLTEAEEDMASVSKVLDSGDQLAAALAEAKKFRELAGGLQARVNSMTAEIADLKRSVAYWEKKAKAVAA
jgi:chromosome segregation ATPase